MSTNLKNVAYSAVENGVEDGVQSFVYKRMNQLSRPFLDNYKGDSEFDEAMQSFIQTLSMGMALYAYTKITSFFFERSIKIGTVLWSYIVAGKMKKALFKKLKNSKFKGAKGVKALTLMMDTDRTSERIEISKIIQNNVKSYDSHKFHFQNQHDKKERQVDSMMNPLSTFSQTYDQKAFNKFQDLTKRGAWKNTPEHKKIYEKATGFTLAQTGEGSWTKLHAELNKYTEFSRTVENEIVNTQKAIMNLVAVKG